MLRKNAEIWGKIWGKNGLFFTDTEGGALKPAKTKALYKRK